MGKQALNIHERFLRHLWSRQYVRRQELRTVEGIPLRVINAGVLNTDGGPDFRDAVLQIGGVTYHGDVEIHRTESEWLHHRHQRDPRYNRVVLHVVLEKSGGPAVTRVPGGRSVPVLILEPFLDESIHTLWQKAISDERVRAAHSIRCYGRNQSVESGLIVDWLRHLSSERLELKLRRFDERLHELAQVGLMTVGDYRHHNQLWRIQGDPDDIPPPDRQPRMRDLAKREHWDQLFYEGLMECLGYSKNQEPFLRLARAVSLREIRSQNIENNEEALQALFLGAAGLLPKIKSARGIESKSFVRRLTAEWRVRRRMHRSTVLHPADWQFFPTRPSNFPTIRIAASVSLVKKILCEDLFRRTIETIRVQAPGTSKLRLLRSLLSVEPPPFWKTHYNFDGPVAVAFRALGADRADEIIVNAVVPLALLYARTFRDRLVREETLHLFEAVPPSGGNSVTRLLERQLFRERVRLASACLQQGAIQLYKFYCADQRCPECRVGEVVFKDERLSE